MKKNILILCSLIATLTIWTIYQDRKQAPAHLFSAPNFYYETLQSKKGNLHDFKGKVILLHFWATWCAPCLTELPTLIDLAKDQKDLVVLTVAVKDTKGKINSFLTKLGKTSPDNFIIALDPDKKISKDLFGTYKLPESFLIKPDLSLSQKIIGAEENWHNRKWNNKIKDLSLLK